MTPKLRQTESPSQSGKWWGHEKLLETRNEEQSGRLHQESQEWGHRANGHGQAEQCHSPSPASTCWQGEELLVDWVKTAGTTRKNRNGFFKKTIQKLNTPQILVFILRSLWCLTDPKILSHFFCLFVNDRETVSGPIAWWDPPASQCCGYRQASSCPGTLRLVTVHPFAMTRVRLHPLTRVSAAASTVWACSLSYFWSARDWTTACGH